MKEIKTVLFRLESSGEEGRESNETLSKKYEEYKKKLGKIISEKEVTGRRGKLMEITYE